MTLDIQIVQSLVKVKIFAKLDFNSLKSLMSIMLTMLFPLSNQI